MTVRADLMISLDGYGTTTDQTPENPFGEDWGRLTATFAATRTFRERVLGMTDGSGTDDVDDRYAAGSFADTGAEIMGAGMFGLHLHRDDPSWTGWWGDEPPFRIPVFVLTHEARPSLEFANSTVFHFLAVSPEDALERAVAAAGGGGVRIGGGINVARTYLAAGLIDQLHVAITPILLSRGLNLWDDLRGLESDYAVSAETAPSGTIHLTLRR